MQGLAVELRLQVWIDCERHGRSFSFRLCRNRLTADMARGDEGYLSRRARQQEFKFYDRAIRDTDDGGANRKKE